MAKPCLLGTSAQGMDHENERAVFNLIVNACKNSKTQYIVLTPKLLTNLMYEDHCRVLVVFNGSIPSNSSGAFHHLPQSRSKQSLCASCTCCCCAQMCFLPPS